MKKLIKYKHWYTEPFDYSDDTDVSWSGKEKFWLSENGDLIVRIARVYAIDEAAFSARQLDDITSIIIGSKVDITLPHGYFISENGGEFELIYSFEPVGIQVYGQLLLASFEQWEQKWHELLELAEFPYKYEDVAGFSY